jgi:hypothetical protein
VGRARNKEKGQEPDPWGSPNLSLISPKAGILSLNLMANLEPLTKAHRQRSNRSKEHEVSPWERKLKRQ